MEINKGDIYEIEFPFIKSEFTGMTEDGFYTSKTWIPGCKTIFCEPDDTELIANGVGNMILKCVDVFKPGIYPTRIFYTRKWQDPDGKIFGKNSLKIRVKWHFIKLLQGYYHPYSLIYVGDNDA